MANIICCFDIGIKNLAYCVYDSSNKKILDWNNYSLLEDSNVADVKEKYKCILCDKNALYTYIEKYYCTKHCVKPIFKDLSGNILKVMPNVSILKEMLKLKGKVSKEELHTKVKETYALPIVKKKSVKKLFDMESLHDSIRKFVIDHKESLGKASVIGLENQPVLKNPNMKTVQILLYGTLRDILTPIPKMKLIHAGKKVKDTEVGEAGYADRKKASVERTKDFLKKQVQEIKFHELFHNSIKQNDLSDSLAMCIDYVF
jgi:hypothetical protein